MTGRTERDMLDLLARRHSTVNHFGFPRWVYAENVHNYQFGSEVDAIALDGFNVPDDALPPLDGATDRWQRRSLPNDVHGFEVKVSRGDWLREHRTAGRKSLLWRRYCSHWWIVVPDGSIIHPGELPDGWGLLVETSSGGLRARVPARRVEDTEQIPHALHVLIGRAAIRTRDRAHQVSMCGAQHER